MHTCQRLKVSELQTHTVELYQSTAAADTQIAFDEVSLPKARQQLSNPPETRTLSITPFAMHDHP